MGAKKRYEFNAETLAYELHRVPLKKRISKGMMLFLLSLVFAAGYYFFYIKVLKLETPRTITLRQSTARLRSKLEVMERRMGESKRKLQALEMRDDNVYRPIFGMDEIPADERAAGYGFPEKYVWLQNYDNSNMMVDAGMQMDELYVRAAVQSESYDRVSVMAKRAGEMASCVPTIPPVMLSHIKLSSRFGVRTDPIEGGARIHSGIDLAGRHGEAIYASGNGRVESAEYSFFGYGNVLVINHGFGYKTRYAHLYRILVRQGAYIQRGQEVGLMGSSGRSTGTHLHYEVEYRGRKVNPLNYFNSKITPEEYKRMIEQK